MPRLIFTAFSTDSDSYEPLGDFLKLVTEEKLRVCLFLGPFVDAKNELIVNNNFQVSLHIVMHDTTYF